MKGSISRRPWLGPAIMLAALTPALSMCWQLTRVPSSQARDADEEDPRAKLLRQIPTDPAVLINVAHSDLPASPDILNLGKRSTKALERCLSDNVDPGARALCAVVLESLGDRRALPTLRAALDDWEPQVRHRVINALAAMPDKANVEPLLKLYARKDEEPWIRVATLHALGAVSDQRVVRRLRDDLRVKPAEGDTDLRSQVFRALWRNRHLMARETVIADTRGALGSDNHALVMEATLASSELSSPRLVSALIPLMEHPNAEIRNKAVYALGRIGDPTATKALLTRLPKVRESRMLNNIAFALERLDKQAFYASIKEVVEHKQAIIRLNAAFVLGDVRHPEGLPMLEGALKDASDFVRTSAIVAVGKLGVTDEAEAKRATDALTPFVTDQNLSVREEAIHSLHHLTRGGRADLLHELFAKIDADKFPGVVQRAALALGDAGDGRVRDYLVSCLLSGPCDVGEVGPFVEKHGDGADKGRVLLSWARRDDRLTPLVATLKPSGTLPIASSALSEDWPLPGSSMTTASLRVLGALGDASVADLVKRRANSDDTWARVEASVALARLGDGPARTKLVDELQNLPAEWLPRFVRAASLARESAATAELDPLLEKLQGDGDPQIALAAAAIRLAWEPEKAAFRFLDALASKEGFERDLGEAYLVKSKGRKVTWLVRRMLAREGREDVRDRLRAILERRGKN